MASPTERTGVFLSALAVGWAVSSCAHPYPAPPAGSRPPFDKRTMTAPVCDGPNLEISGAAILAAKGHRVRHAVTCAIGTEGRVYDCRVLETIPNVDPPPARVAASYERIHCSRPVTQNGRPIDVDYTWATTLEIEGGRLSIKRE